MSAFCFQKQMWQCFRATEHNDLERLRLTLTLIESIERYQNYCGQTLLHRAVLNNHLGVAEWLLSKYQGLVNVPDNVSEHNVTQLYC